MMLENDKKFLRTHTEKDGFDDMRVGFQAGVQSSPNQTVINPRKIRQAIRRMSYSSSVINAIYTG